MLIPNVIRGKANCHDAAQQSSAWLSNRKDSPKAQKLSARRVPSNAGATKASSRHSRLQHGALMQVRIIGVFLAGAFLFASITAASAQTAQEQGNQNNPAAEKGSFSILFENDIFDNADHDYTNGVELAYTTAPEIRRAGWWIRRARCPSSHRPAMCARAMRSARPYSRRTDFRLANPPPTDRPYAGFLFGTIGLGGDSGTHLDQLQFTLGVVGPMRWPEKPKFGARHYRRQKRRAGTTNCTMSLG